MRALSNTSYEQLVHSNAESCGLGRWKAPPGLLRRVFRNTVHYLSHKFILDRRSTRSVQAGGFRLAIYPSVFHPKLFLTSEFFARFLPRSILKVNTLPTLGLAVAYWPWRQREQERRWSRSTSIPGRSTRRPTTPAPMDLATASLRFVRT